MEYVRTDLLIDVNTLSQRLNDDNLRIFDTSVFLTPQQGGGYLVESGREKYQTAHIPGAGFIDLIKHWSNASSILNFTLPDEQRLGEVFHVTGYPMRF